MMFIETALKSIAWNTIMTEIGSSSIYDMYDKAISSYKNSSTGTHNDIKKKYQTRKLNLQGSKLATTSSTGGLILALKRADCIHA